MPRGLPRCPHGELYDLNPTDVCGKCSDEYSNGTRGVCQHGLGFQFGCTSCGRTRLEYCEHGNEMRTRCVQCDDKSARLEGETLGEPREPAWSYR